MPGNIINLTPADLATWPTPNYDNPYQRRWMPEYAGVLYGVATLMVAMRLWIRAKKYAGGLGLDDVLLFLSWLCVSWFTALAIIGAEMYYTSRHVWDIPITFFAPMAKITWLAELAFLLTGCFVKISVLLFFRRLVESTCSRLQIWAVIAAMAFTSAYTLAFILALVFNCTPTEAYWRAFDPMYRVEYTCVDTTVINLLAGILAAISDLYAVAFPCIMMRNLNLPRRQKVALNIIFSLGLLVVGASGVRTYHLWEVGHSTDVSTSIWDVFVWSQLELNLGIMCACAPSLRVLFREYLSGSLSRIKRSLSSGDCTRDPDGEHVIITRTDSPRDHERVDFGSLNIHKSSSLLKLPEICRIAEPRSPLMMREPYLVQTPDDFVNYNLHSIEKSAQQYRESTQATRSSSDRSRRTKSYSRLEDYELSRVDGKSWYHAT